MSTLAEQVRELEARCESHKQRADSNYEAVRTRDEMMDDMANRLQALKRDLAAAESRLAQARDEALGDVLALFNPTAAYAGYEIVKRIKALREYPAVPEGGEPCPHVDRDARNCCICRPTPTPERVRVVAGWQSEETHHGDTEVWYYAMCEDGSVWGRPSWNSDKPWEQQAPPLAAQDGGSV